MAATVTVTNDPGPLVVGTLTFEQVALSYDTGVRSMYVNDNSTIWVTGNTILTDESNRRYTAAIPEGGEAVILDGTLYTLLPFTVSATSTPSSRNSPASGVARQTTSTSDPTTSQTLGFASTGSSTASSIISVASTANSTTTTDAISSAPSTSPIDRNHAPSTYTSAEIAGAAIGTGIGTAILAFLVTFVIMRSRQRNGLHRSRSDTKAPSASSKPFLEKTGLLRN